MQKFIQNVLTDEAISFLSTDVFSGFTAPGLCLEAQIILSPIIFFNVHFQCDFNTLMLIWV